MDRTITYPGAIPLDTDILAPQRYAMIQTGMILRAMLGTTTIADGLACAATAPASMSVSVGSGALVANLVVDSSAYGSLASDTTNALVKMGVNLAATTIGPFTPPATAGQSQNFLIQAALSETDTSATVLPYYNASNPSAPYSGPANAGTAQNTRRVQTVTLSLKAGAAATTGSQTTPTPDSGYVGLWVITVPNGATTLTASNIAEYELAPFLRTKLPSVRWRLSGNLNLYVSTTGNDSNSGLSPGTALATLSAAWEKIVNTIDLNGHVVTVNIADGTYAPLLCGGYPIGADSEDSVIFLGNLSTPANVVIAATNASAVVALNGAQFRIRGVKCTASGTGSGQGWGIAASGSGCRVKADVFDIGACGAAQIACYSCAQIALVGAHTFSGSAPAALAAGVNGVINSIGNTTTLTGTPAYSLAFASASVGGVVQIVGTFSGSATGARYSATGNGVVDTNGGGASYLPGNASGSYATGGQYL